MAWRETRAASGEICFRRSRLALGAAALTAVTGFNESVRYTLLREARALMAADISLRMPIQPSAEEEDFLGLLEAKGILTTRVTETVSMASMGQGTAGSGFRQRGGFLALSVLRPTHARSFVGTA